MLSSELTNLMRAYWRVGHLNTQGAASKNFKMVVFVVHVESFDVKGGRRNVGDGEGDLTSLLSNRDLLAHLLDVPAAGVHLNLVVHNPKDFALVRVEEPSAQLERATPILRRAHLEHLNTVYGQHWCDASKLRRTEHNRQRGALGPSQAVPSMTTPT